MVAVFTVTVAIVVVPWKNTSSAPAQVPVNRYAMLDDGRAVLVRTTDGNGHLLEFESRTIELLPGLRALNDLPLAFADAVAEHIAGRGKTRNDALSMTGRITGARVADMLRRKVAADGTTSTEEEVQVLDGRGLFVLGFRTLGSDPQPTIAEPALQLLPPDPRKGDHWSQTGTIGSLAYQWEASISDVAPATATLGSFDDCLTVTSSLTITDPAAPSSSQLLDVYCAGVGAVTGSSTRTDGEHRALDTVAVDDRAPAGVPDVAPSVRDHAADGPAGDPSGWVLSRVGSALPISTIGAETVPPVYLPTQPPSVLASTDAGGDLVSLDLGDVSGSVAWRFPTAGAIYSEPRYDAARGRIYVGATDGRLRALDSRGLFLWSTPSGDNVATRPAVANDTVVFGSEDGAAYGVDATTGERRWRTKLAGAAASSPAVSGDVVAIGDDGATVTGLDTGNGAERWTYAAGDAVEAPVGLAGGDFLVADRGGAVARLDPASGEERWTADAGRGSAVRAEPVLFGDLVLAVDDSGTLSALDAATGDVRWRHRERGYVGSPAMVGTDAVVASADGRVHVIDAAGNVVATIETQDARGGAPAGFDYGPTVGGGMVWLADKTGTVWRLGPAAQGSSQLAAAWLHASVDAPFAAFPFVSSAVAWRDSAVVLDTRRHSFFIDPTSGTTTAGPVVGKDGDVLLADPVVAGDTLLIDAGSRLLAVDLPSGAERWSQPLVGTRYLPPAVQGNTVVTI
ncbi:MAG: hypothetical protein QOH79_935, partial [Acidimicrobiaceae bacterium]